MVKRIQFIFLLLIGLLLPLNITALSGDEILKRAHLFGEAPNIYMELTMDISLDNGSKERGIELYLHRDGGNSKLLLQVVEPVFLRNMKFLQYQDKDGSSRQWMKTSRGVRRIAGSGGNEPIFGSNFTADDFRSTKRAHYTVTAQNDGSFEGTSCYVLTLKPKESSSEYNKELLYIEKDTFLIIKTEYYKNQEKVREYRLIEQQDLKGTRYPQQCVMENLSDGTSTTLIFNTITEKNFIPARIFNRGNL